MPFEEACSGGVDINESRYWRRELENQEGEYRDERYTAARGLTLEAKKAMRLWEG